MSKNYVLDTNVLLDAPNAVEVLQDTDNTVYVPWTVLQELDKLKSLTKTRHRAIEAIKILSKTDVYFLRDSIDLYPTDSPDDAILMEITLANINNPILVTNDIMLRLKAQKLYCIEAQEYKKLVPFKADSQKVTGFSTIEYDSGGNEICETIDWNTFYWKEGKLHFYSKNGPKCVDYENSPWGIKPKTAYQNAALELMLDPEINLVTVQSEAGFGKTFLSLAAGLYLTFEKKEFKKIYVLKPNIEIGQELGFLPGGLDEKLDPYFRNVHNLLLKLHEMRPCNKAFKKDDEHDLTSISSVNKSKFEYIPLNFLRGMEFSDCFILIDETQNLTKDQLKTVLSRIGENVKCVCTGDTEQVDNPACNPENNGLNWAVKLFNGEHNYAHIVLKGKADRGPICSLVRKCWK